MNKIAFQLGAHLGQTKSAGQGWNRLIQMLMGGAEKAEAAAGRTIPKGAGRPVVNAPRVGEALTGPVASQVGSGLKKGLKYVAGPAAILAGANELYQLGRGMPAAVAGAANKTQGAYRGTGR